MATTTLQMSFGDENMNRLAKWREIEKFPADKTMNSFVRAMVMRELDKIVPE